jgi:poly(A) polymerase
VPHENIIHGVTFLRQTDAARILGKFSDLLARQGPRAYIVGGFVRDCLLGRETRDIDIAIDGDAIALAQKVAKAVEGKFVLLDERNGVARVLMVERDRQTGSPEGGRSSEAEWHLDFSSFSGNIESDLARRDFTINAMAVELKQFVIAVSRSPERSEGPAKQSQVELIDPFFGQKDLNGGIVRATSNEIFESDATRLLRAVRIAAELGFAIEPGTEGLIRGYSHYISKVPGERTREELLRLLRLPRAAYYLMYLDKLGLLLALIPEMAECKGVEQPRLHFWDVFDHSLQTVAAIEFLIRENALEYGSADMLSVAPWSEAIDQHLSHEVSSGSNHKALLKLGGLLHDIAKPQTKSVDDEGRAHFYGHTNEGADMAAAILERLRFSNRETSLVKSLVYHHLRPAQMANEELPTQRAIYRYFRDTGDAGIDILLLALADYLASRGPLVDMEEWREHCQLINYILTEHDKQQVQVLPLKLIDGHDLMNAFGLAPGPLIGELLAMVHEAQASGDIATKEEALAAVQRELSLRAQRSNLSETKVK